MKSAPRSSLRSPFLAVAAVMGALWVNRDWIGSFFDTGDPGSESALAEGQAMPMQATQLPAAPGGPALVFTPLAQVLELEDPFTHDLETLRTAAQVRGQELQSLRLPLVRLVLHGPASSRALVDGKICGLGDQLEIGRIVAIGSDGIRVSSATHGLVHVPLAARIERAKASPGDAASETAANETAASEMGTSKEAAAENAAHEKQRDEPK